MNKVVNPLRLDKLIEGREKWRERSNFYQKEKRKLQDKNRYLEKSLREKKELLVNNNNELTELKKNF